MTFQLVQLAGALCILAAFVLLQFRRIGAETRGYLALNLVGAAVLTGTAWIAGQWGFVLLEGVWAAVSLFALLRLPARPRS